MSFQLYTVHRKADLTGTGTGPGSVMPPVTPGGILQGIVYSYKCLKSRILSTIAASFLLAYLVFSGERETAGV